MTKPAPKPKRPSKKTDMLEVRVSPEEKAAFLAACRELGRSASTVIRKSMRVETRRVQERPGRLKMLVTMGAMLPVLMLSAIQPEAVEPVGNVQTSDREMQIPRSCLDTSQQGGSIWPVSLSGEALVPPAEGVRINVLYDVSAEGRVYNVRSQPTSFDAAYAEAAEAIARTWCFPHGPAQSDVTTQIQFEPAS
tara:strand:- start:3294 stop:3872 length:579 start_codon:yes stop_codon:yes gene_type:complete